MLEADGYKESAFVTLTYNEQNVPADGSVHPEELVPMSYGTWHQFICNGAMVKLTCRPRVSR
jgi:hypothetical protein